ncbi:hypothetical protein [Arthrobacter glacialis]|uniref:hypothetical protein n=1 Tax=Arthrobacter glacialis TaxID=1664 RepID=UPI001FAF666B|nr:hypothetical protein [Arthrobacter glacialis]
MTRENNPDLLDTIARLTGENEALRLALGTKVGPSMLPARGKGVAHPHQRSWGWTLLATALIVIGALLAPVATVASWAKVQLTNTESFVATYAPLANDPSVQAYVADQAVNVIQQNVDIPALTSDVFDGITALGTGPAATRALEALKAPAAQGIVSLVRSTVGTFVESDAFAQVWREALRLSHSQLIATLQNDPQAAMAVGSDGSVGIQLGPIIERVKVVLLERGLTFAAQIPAIDRTITVSQNSSLPTLQLFYGLALAAGAWLPWIALLFLGAGVAVARRKSLALVWAAVALGLGMVVVVAGIAIGRIVFIGSVSPSLIPSGMARTIFDAVTTAMSSTGLAVLLLAIVVAITAWAAGPFPVASRLRSFFQAGTTRLRQTAEQHGITTGRTGHWFYAQRTLIRAAIAVIAAAVVLFVRPLTTGLIVWTLVISVVVLAIVELVQRPVALVPWTGQDVDGHARAVPAVD